MSIVDDKDLERVIRETLGLDRSDKKKLNEVAYVLQPKKYNIQTDVLSQKSIDANIADFEDCIKAINQVSARLETADRSEVSYKDSAFRSLKSSETYNVNNAFLTSMHFDNTADPNSKVMMDSLAYMRLSRDFGTFEDWQKDFIACAMAVRNGFVMTAFSVPLNRYINIIVDEDGTGPMLNSSPVISLCIKERFYFRDYLNDRRAYIYAMMKELNWNVIEERVKKTDKIAKIMQS
jgi:Fe-Mn family superoxide dismutase